MGYCTASVDPKWKKTFDRKQKETIRLNNESAPEAEPLELQDILESDFHIPSDSDEDYTPEDKKGKHLFRSIGGIRNDEMPEKY